MKLTIEDLHAAEYALWDGRDAGLDGDALYLHLRASYPGVAPWRGGPSGPFLAWIRHARRLACLPTRRERLVSWTVREVAKASWLKMADRLDVSEAQLRRWVRGVEGDDVRLTRLIGRVCDDR